MAKVRPTVNVLDDLRAQLRCMRREISAMREDIVLMRRRVRTVKDVVAGDAAANHAAFAKISKLLRSD
jgi:hypothetical protein